MHFAKSSSFLASPQAVCAIGCEMQCVSQPFSCVLKMEEHRPSQRKKPRFPLSFEGQFGEDEKVQALKQRLHSAKQTLGLHRNMDCCLPCSTCWKVNNTNGNRAPLVRFDNWCLCVQLSLYERDSEQNIIYIGETKTQTLTFWSTKITLCF